MGDTPANAATQLMLFEGTCYMTPILGAWLADSLWGRYRTILVFSGIYFVVSAAAACNIVPLASSSHWSFSGQAAQVSSFKLAAGADHNIINLQSLVVAYASHDTWQAVYRQPCMR